MSLDIPLPYDNDENPLFIEAEVEVGPIFKQTRVTATSKYDLPLSVDAYDAIAHVNENLPIKTWITPVYSDLERIQTILLPDFSLTVAVRDIYHKAIEAFRSANDDTSIWASIEKTRFLDRNGDDVTDKVGRAANRVKAFQAIDSKGLIDSLYGE